MGGVHREYSIHCGEEGIYIEGGGEVIYIDKATGQVNEHSSLVIPTQNEVIRALGIIGIINLPGGLFLISIIKSKRIGNILENTIWKIEETRLIRITQNTLNQNQQQDHATFLGMIESVLATPSFYYCYSYDITHTQQRLSHTISSFKNQPLIERADKRFIWNSHLLAPFVKNKNLNRFCLPIIHGFVSIKSVYLNGNTLDWALISKRSIHRAGTRYFMRGADLDGNVANYVETEQLVIYNRSVASFVLTRGSIPFVWTQRPNIKYKPKPEVSTVDDQLRIFKRHADEQIVLYGRQVLVNLIDQKGGEKVLESNFADIVNRADNKMIKYVHFDFHKECSKMRWHRLQILMDRLKGDIDDQNYYLSTADGTVLQRQNGVFRVNCIDCLDRTNVVHSMLARVVLESQLVKLGLFTPDQNIKQYQQFNDLYQNIWADNADACSTQYAGTGALKTDYTRTGQRTKFGLLMDGKNSAVRYYKNNFCDGYRQDSIDFFLGNYIWSNLNRSPFQDSIQIKVRVIPIILIVSFSMSIIGAILPPSESWSEQVMFVMFWMSTMFGSLVYVLRHGPIYVNQPLLVQTLNRDK
jgi:hypothetical protein